MELFLRYHSKKELLNGAGVIRSKVAKKSVVMLKERCRQTHGGLNNYKQTAGDTQEQMT
jgi:hypothetical protein